MRRGSFGSEGGSRLMGDVQRAAWAELSFQQPKVALPVTDALEDGPAELSHVGEDALVPV